MAPTPKPLSGLLLTAPLPMTDLPVPGLRRRLAAFLYEGVLMFGLVMLVGLLYGGLTQQRHALRGSLGLQVVLFLSIGAYFVFFWTRNGQTLAMKTWHIQLLDPQGQRVSQRQALARYLLSWLWFLPALLVAHLVPLSTTSSIMTTLGAGVLAYALLSFALPGRQFLHDALCRTRLVDRRPGIRPQTN